MNRKLQIGFVFLLIIVSIKFFDAQFVNQSVINYLQYLMILVALFLSLPYIATTKKGFVFPVQLLLLSFLISIPMAYIYWEQGLKDGLIATAPYLMFAFFFYLLRTNFPIKILEKIIVIYGVLYILLYLFQFINAPTILFGKSLWGDEFTENRGIVRIIFPGGGLFILSSFLAVTKLTSQRKHLWFWGIMTIFGVVIPVLQVTRQFIAGILLIYLYHSIKNLSLSKKIGIIVSFATVAVIVQYLSLPVIEGLIESTESDASQGSDYIRILAGEYFLFDFSPSALTGFFGNGVPYTGVSNYGIFLDMLNDTQGFFLSDVGLIAVYAMFGIPAVLAYILIWVKSFTYSLPKEYYYLKYYLWFLLITSLTWYTPYHYHYLATTIIVLYMYQTLTENHRMENTQDTSSKKETVTDNIEQ